MSHLSLVLLCFLLLHTVSLSAEEALRKLSKAIGTENRFVYFDAECIMSRKRESAVW